MMNYTSKQPKNFIKSIQIIHIALLISVVLFAMYVIITTWKGLFFSYHENKPFLYLAILISFAGNLASKYLYAKLIKQIPAKSNLVQKAIKYSTAHIFRVAMLEFPAFMCIIFVLQSYNSFYFILAGILLLMMLTVFPTKTKFENDVPLTSNEKSILEKL